MDGLKLRHVSEELGVSIPTLRRWIRSGKLGAVRREGRFGEEWIVAAEEVERVREPDRPAVGAAYWKTRCEQLLAESEQLRGQVRRLRQELECERAVRGRRERQLRQLVAHAESLEQALQTKEPAAAGEGAPSQWLQGLFRRMMDALGRWRGLKIG
ncbi:MAG: helix-turn-helix domain-containing protein [Armatimonadetes bacterium]|nr:helix-turn-helix domain-containing protein [Armatimonadota bacterium]